MVGDMRRVATDFKPAAVIVTASAASTSVCSAISGSRSAFNLVTLSNPNGTFSTAVNNNFGKILTAGTTRQVQLGQRLTF